MAAVAAAAAAATARQQRSVMLFACTVNASVVWSYLRMNPRGQGNQDGVVEGQVWEVKDDDDIPTVGALE
jgi:hypothetical protein